MNNYKFYFIIIILIIYIISPLDFFPFVFDDLIASGFLFYFWNKFKNQKNKRNYYSKSRAQQAYAKTDSNGQMNLDEACRLLNVSPDTPWSEVQKAYKEKMTKSHPDKVAHLGEELQEKAKELAININNAYNVIKQYKGS